MQQDLFELLQKSPAFFEEFIFKEGSHQAWQLMTAMLLTIETQGLATSNFSDSATPNQLKSAVSIKVLNLFSHLYYPILTFLLLLIALQLRDIALKKFQLTELELPGIAFMSAFLASAGKNVTELSFHTKVTTK